jgi:hypothetical protein
MGRFKPIYHKLLASATVVRENQYAFRPIRHVLLAEGARFNEAISRLSQTTFVPKGIYRFRSHDAANRHAEDCLVRGMGRLAATRARELTAAP